MPASSPSAASLRDKYCKRKSKVCSIATTSKSEVKLLENQSEKDASKTTEEIKESAQTTLFDFKQPDSACSTSGEDAPLKHVLDALSALKKLMPLRINTGHLSS